MKHQKNFAVAVSCVAVLLLLSTVVFAANSHKIHNNSGADKDNVSENVDGTKIDDKIVPIGITVKDGESEKEPKISADISEEELSQGYKAFLKFIDDNNLPVSCDYKEFKQQYYALGYDGIDDYLESIYGIFDLGSEEKDNEQQTIQEPTFTNNPDDYRAGLPYSDEILDAYEYYTITLTKNGIFVEMSLENFVDEYEKSGKDSISSFCSNLIEKHLEIQS